MQSRDGFLSPLCSAHSTRGKEVAALSATSCFFVLGCFFFFLFVFRVKEDLSLQSSAGNGLVFWPFFPQAA